MKLINDYLIKDIVNEDISINFLKAFDLLEVEFLQNLLDEIIIYEKYIRKESINIKNILETDDINNILQNYVDGIKIVQENTMAIRINKKY